MIKKLLFAICFILILPTICLSANTPVYKLNSNYVAVREDIFNKLATNDRLIDVLNNQVESLTQDIKDIEQLNKEKTDKYEKEINNLKMALQAKEEIIALKDDNIKQYKNLEILYNANSGKIKKMKRLNVWQKIFVTGIVGYAISETESNGAKVALGALGLTNIAIEW